METKFLYSNICPLLIKKDQEIISDCFREEIKKSDQLKISVGYFSHKSLLELDKLIAQQNIKSVCLILGMYLFNRFPKKSLQLALEINTKWQKLGIGEIRVPYSFKYHGKLYCFIKNNQIFSAIMGSPNLSFLTIEDQVDLNQYEIAFFTRDSKLLKDSLEHINSLELKEISENIVAFAKRQLHSNKKAKCKKIKNSKMDWNYS